jgi:hypothetical protein
VHVRIARTQGRRRRFALLAPIAAVVAIGGLAVVNSDAGATSGPQPVPPPSEPANQLTVNVAADGTITLPFRSTLPCDVSFCPPSGSYTEIAPGKTNIIVNDPSGTKAQVAFGKVLSRNVGPRNEIAHARTTLKTGQLTIFVTIARHKVARLVLVVESAPYATTTTTAPSGDSSSAPPTSSTPTSTGQPPLQHVVVTLTGGDGGDTGTLTVSPNPSQAGPTDVVLIDNRTNKIGTAQLFLDVHPGLGHIPLGTPGQHVTQVMCPYGWIAYVEFASGTGPTTTTVYAGPTYGAHTEWDVEGVDPVDCTTPIT